jgi:hypothetical protein
MVGLAFFFRLGLERMGLSPENAALVRGPVYFAIGLALAYGALVYLAALVRFLGWWTSDRRPETIPLAPLGGRPPANGQAAAAARQPVAESR